MDTAVDCRHLDVDLPCDGPDGAITSPWDVGHPDTRIVLATCRMFIQISVFYIPRTRPLRESLNFISDKPYVVASVLCVVRRYCSLVFGRRLSLSRVPQRPTALHPTPREFCATERQRGSGGRHNL